MQRLSEAQRNQAIGMLRVESKINDVVRNFGCSRQTIHKIFGIGLTLLMTSRNALEPVGLVQQRYGLIALLRESF